MQNRKQGAAGKLNWRLPPLHFYIARRAVTSVKPRCSIY